MAKAPITDDGSSAGASPSAPIVNAGQSQHIKVPGGYVIYNSSTGKLQLQDGTPLPGWKVGHGGVEKGGKILHLSPTGQPIVETRTTTITPGAPTATSGPQLAPQPGGSGSSSSASGTPHVTSTYTTLDGHAIADPTGGGQFSSPQGPGLPARNDHAGQPHPPPPTPPASGGGGGRTGRDSSAPPPPPGHAPAYGNFQDSPVTMQQGTAKAILDAGMGLIGTPYLWGGANPAQGGVDCSGLIQYLYAKQGVNLPRVADDQAKSGKRVSAGQAQPGDLVAFDTDPTKPGMDHIGIYLGNGLMLQSPHSGSAVQVVKVDLNTAGAISRVLPDNAYAGLGKTSHGLAYQLPKGVTVGGTSPVKIGTAIGGGDAGSSTGGVMGLPKDPTTAQVNAAVAKNFGYLSAFLHDPEVGPILRNAALKGWDQSTLFGALYNTKWWQNTSATTRQWDSDQKLDPASNRNKLNPVMADLSTQAQRAGLALTPLQIHDLSVNSLRFGWNAQQTTNALLAVGKLQVGPNSAPSDALSSKQALKQIANQYHIPVSDPALDKWTTDILSGRMSTNDFTAYAANQAKSLFPSITSAIDQGHTVEQYLDPYRQIAAQTLDRGPDSFDFINDPKYSAALNQIDPKTGQRTAMSLADFQTKLKSDPTYGFQHTAAAKSSTADIAETIDQMWGAVA